MEFEETYTEYEDIDDFIALEDTDIPETSASVDASSFPHPLYQLKLDYSQETLYGSAADLQLQPNEYVIAQTRYGVDMARVVGLVEHPIGAAPSDVVSVTRKAVDEDIQRSKENIEKETAASELFKEKVLLHKLDMKLVGCHYLLEEPKVLFFFTADTRIDFRKLVKDLVAILRIRIELRQIGVRDESRMTGGIGCCGRPFCCHAVTDKLRPVSIKMAKEQNLSLNSLKISGQCGRLLCCLAYEYDWYIETRKHLPTVGTGLYYDNTFFRISEINLITEVIVLSGEDGRVISIPAKRFVQHNGKWKIS
ncbi:MAG: PSP1 domain-containing protein [Treponema sp.]|uniref:PSP1 domain-containing protein n=1 Tax=Treponema sp. TaxID=166 RepID=UPI003FA2FCD8